MPFLLHRTIDGQTQLLRVQGTVLRIGRGTGNDLTFPDAAVALSHAEIQQDREGFLLVDRSTVIGTLVNDEPVQSVRLRDDDRITVGPYLIRVQITDPSDPLFLTVSPLTVLEETQAGVLPPGAPEGAAPARPERRRDPWAARADYARTYGLRRAYLSKALLATALVILAALWVWHFKGEALAGKTTFHRPGGLSASHSIVPKLTDCAQCHTPWRAIEDQKCEVCHAGPVHQATQSRTPPCGDCHSEHRPGPVLADMPDFKCAQCHGALTVRGGGEPLKVRDREIERFAAGDHPEILPAGDTAVLALNHALHLAPNLLSGDGTRVQLDCADCHVVGGAVVQVTFEQHCQRCHDLRFDDRLPELEAPHGDLDGMLRAILGTYVKDRDGLAALSRQDLRRLVFDRGGAVASFDEQTRRLARRASREMVRLRCVKCHAVRDPGGPDAEVVPPNLPRQWYTAAHFTHGPHLQIAGINCDTCHAPARTSRQTRDVLLPGIASCLPCHGIPGEGGETPHGWTPTRCVTCHYYHEGSPDWPVVLAALDWKPPTASETRNDP